jgi:hypothetical protein
MTSRSMRDGGVAFSSLRFVRSATMWVAPCARAVRTGTDSLTPASTKVAAADLDRSAGHERHGGRRTQRGLQAGLVVNG